MPFRLVQSVEIAAVHESAPGTSPTSTDIYFSAANGWKADFAFYERPLPPPVEHSIACHYAKDSAPACGAADLKRLMDADDNPAELN
jgi:hypothetical protein